MTTREWLKRVAKRAKKDFRFYESVAHKVIVDGQEFMVEFFCLGCNASHYFYVGILPDDRLVYRSFGEDGEVPVEYEGKTYQSYDITYKEHIKVLKPGEFPGYLGHL